MNIRELVKSDYLKLVPILALAFYMAFIPHQNYPYPVHIDEWMHLAYSEALIRAGNIIFPDPWYGGEVSPYPNLEVGFHALWAIFHQISGISWLTIFRYFPSVIFMITVLSVYILAQREGFGWEAALLTCLIPTTVGILGPGFLVPVAMGLLFIPLSLFIVLNFRSWWSYVVLFILMCFLLAIHAATAVILVIILAPHIALNLKGEFRHSLGLVLTMVMPFLGIVPWTFNLLLPTAKSLIVSQPPYPFVDLPPIIRTFGYLPTLLCLAGTFILAIKGTKRDYSMTLGLLALLLMLVTFFAFHYGVPILYYRGLMAAMLMMSIVAGAGLMWVKNLRLPDGIMVRLKAPPIVRHVGYVLCLVLMGATLYVAIPARQNTLYYHMIDGEDYEAFIWIKENVDSSYSKAILDPWKATAFTAITGKQVYTRIHEYPKPSDVEAYDFLRGGSSNTTFLKRNGISMVYTKANIDSCDLVEVRKHVYLLKEARGP